MARRKEKAPPGPPRFVVGDRVRVTSAYLKWHLEGSRPPKPSRLDGVTGTITQDVYGNGSFYEVAFDGVPVPSKPPSPTWLMRDETLEQAE